MSKLSAEIAVNFVCKSSFYFFICTISKMTGIVHLNERTRKLQTLVS